MIKLSDIIKSGGGNEKLNRFINRYVLSKKEKKDIINEIKTKGSSSGGSSKYAPRYFSIDWAKCSEEWLKVFDIANDTYIGMQPFASVKVSHGEIVIISSYGTFSDAVSAVKAFSYIPCYAKNVGLPFNIPTDIFTFEQCIEVINSLLPMMGQSILTLDGITEITEEEYYKID